MLVSYLVRADQREGYEEKSQHPLSYEINLLTML